MKELNLTVGQKMWSIQLGDCEVYDKSAKLIYCSNGKRTQSFCKDGKMFEEDKYPSLFESNPFEKEIKHNEGLTWRSPSLGESETGFPCERNKTLEKVSEPENKAEMINALCSVLDCPPLKASVKDIAKDKLQKLLESL